MAVYINGIEKTALTDAVNSDAPTGKSKVTNMYWDPEMRKVVVEKESEPEG